MIQWQVGNIKHLVDIYTSASVNETKAGLYFLCHFFQNCSKEISDAEAHNEV